MVSKLMRVILNKSKKPKYMAKKITIDGYNFDSRAEGQFYMDNKNIIKDLQVHPKYVLQKKFTANDGTKIMSIVYEADFAYGDVVVDIKGLPTEGAKLKRKLFMYSYPNLTLKWIVCYRGQRVDYFENEKRKRDTKKSKLLENNIG